MDTAASVVRRLTVGVTCPFAEFLFPAVVLLTANSDKRDHMVFNLCKMAHANVTVSLVVDVAVIVATVYPLLDEVDTVTPAEKVAV